MERSSWYSKNRVLFIGLVLVATLIAFVFKASSTQKITEYVDKSRTILLSLSNSEADQSDQSKLFDGSGIGTIDDVDSPDSSLGPSTNQADLLIGLGLKKRASLMTPFNSLVSKQPLTRNERARQAVDRFMRYNDVSDSSLELDKRTVVAGLGRNSRSLERVSDNQASGKSKHTYSLSNCRSFAKTRKIVVTLPCVC